MFVPDFQAVPYIRFFRINSLSISHLPMRVACPAHLNLFRLLTVLLVESRIVLIDNNNRV
jgi:hypothetical protein